MKASSNNKFVAKVSGLVFVLDVLKHKYSKANEYDCCNETTKCSNTEILKDSAKNTCLLAVSLLTFFKTSKSIYKFKDSEFLNFLLMTAGFTGAYMYGTKNFLERDTKNTKDLTHLASALLLAHSVANVTINR